MTRYNDVLARQKVHLHYDILLVLVLVLGIGICLLDLGSRLSWPSETVTDDSAAEVAKRDRLERSIGAIRRY